MSEVCCEEPGCSMPCTICPACEQCLCWLHRQKSSCEACQRIISRSSFEYRLRRLLTIGLGVLFCGVLFLFLPRDDNGVNIQLAILLLVVGSILIWFGLLAYT
jgi:hypothetical protein